MTRPVTTEQIEKLIDAGLRLASVLDDIATAGKECGYTFKASEGALEQWNAIYSEITDPWQQLANMEGEDLNL